ncbi:hypothetical protein B0H14DRAFT_2678255 [Mycena olivaceomarginata]|nr:hypothetical protein B0H14DRAFT_2678255 [Mycena olivaceomarginata]
METPPRAHIESRAVAPCLRAEAVCGARLYSSTKAFCSHFHFKRCWIYVIVCVNRRLPPPSITSNLSHHADDPDSSLSDLEYQDLLLCDRLPASLALHARYLRAPSPMRTSMGIVPPTCVPSVLPGNEGIDPLTLLPLSTPALRPPLPFITITRARSSSCESAGSSGAALEIPALVATLLLRRRESKQGRGGRSCRRCRSPRGSLYSRLGMGDIVVSLRCRA